MRVGVVVTAAGSGSRLGADVPKALVSVHGRTLVEWAVTAAASVADAIVVTAPEEFLAEFEAVVSRRSRGSLDARGGEASGPGVVIVPGGATRQESVRAGIAALGEVDLVLVHDAARAFTPPVVFASVVETLRGGRAAVVPALPVVDTIKRADAAMRVTGTADRSELWAVQTPQGFAYDLLVRAHEAGTGREATDDAGLVEALGEAVWLIPGHDDSFKITTPRDLAVAHATMTDSGTIPAGAALVLADEGEAK